MSFVCHLTTPALFLTDDPMVLLAVPSYCSPLTFGVLAWYSGSPVTNPIEWLLRHGGLPIQKQI